MAPSITSSIELEIERDIAITPTMAVIVIGIVVGITTTMPSMAAPNTLLARAAEVIE